MIQTISIIHYLDSEIYNELIKVLESTDNQKHTKHTHTYYLPDNAVKEIMLYDGEYNRGEGHIWLMQCKICFPELDCDNSSFNEKLYFTYGGIFNGLPDKFPPYEEAFCDYIEYSEILRVYNADKTIEKLLEKGWKAEQCDKSRWSEYKKAFGTRVNLVSKEDIGHVFAQVNYDVTSLKKLFKDEMMYTARGFYAKFAVENTEEQIALEGIKNVINKFQRKNKMIVTPDMESILTGDNLSAANEFLSLAKKYGLKRETRYAAAHRTYKCVFIQIKPKRVIFTLEASSRKFNVKANLYGIDGYKDKVPLSGNIISQLKTGAWNCAKYNGGKCNDKCRGGVPLTFDDKTEYKCIGGAFGFNSLSLDEWMRIMTLLEQEMIVVKG